jgi:hypothetical protein
VRRDLGIRCPDRRGLPGHALRVALATCEATRPRTRAPFSRLGPFAHL